LPDNECERLGNSRSAKRNGNRHGGDKRCAIYSATGLGGASIVTAVARCVIRSVNLAHRLQGIAWRLVLGIKRARRNALQRKQKYREATDETAIHVLGSVMYASSLGAGILIGNVHCHAGCDVDRDLGVV
jgi:hypothetical protein